MKIHPLAKKQRPLTPAEFEALKRDIKANKQIHPIARASTGEIVAGVHRAKACEELGIEPKFIDLPKDTNLFDYVVSDSCRRKDKPSQRAMAAARLYNWGKRN